MQSSKPFIPYFKTSRYRVESMIELANVQNGEKAADLGSGDGRISIALAHVGAVVTGYELDESLVSLSKREIEKEGLSNAVEIVQKDFWNEDLSGYSIITVYPMPDIMDDLEGKLLRELKVGSRVLTNYYAFPHWKEVTYKDNIYLYKV